ncbi:MAG: hypothetical protein LCH56_11380 [Proteobacteria bacterium]|nr:hypothetical protein [Pseudomonadota bacterium]
MSAFSSRFLITPETAVQKFLVDMRLTAERSFRSWKLAVDAGFAKTNLAPADRTALLKPHPLEDYFYAGLIGLQAAAVRERFTPTVAEALLRQVALQVDDAVGRDDRIVSNMVFIMFGRIRKNADLDLKARPEDVVTDAILERLAIDRMKATSHLMHDPRYRHALTAPLIARPVWWKAFDEIYMVNAMPRSMAPRGHFSAHHAYAAARTKWVFFETSPKMP